MRVIVLVLVLANLVYASWYWTMERPLRLQQVQPGNLSSTAVVEADQGLSLLSEIEHPRLRYRDVCFELSGFADNERRTVLLERFRQAGLEARGSEREVVEESRHWVLLPPELVAEEEDILLTRLQENNIDSYLISGGELDQGISLGIFTDRERAENLSESLLAMNFSPEIREIERTRSESTIYLGPLSEGLKGGQNWPEYLNLPSGLEVTEKLCETIAPQL